MPIYEFYCASCHRVFQFLARAAAPDRRPACPRCARPDLERRPSSFAISRGRGDHEADDGLPDVDEARLERAMDALAGEAEGLDENDPKSAARLMRRLYETAGLNFSPGIAEAIRRMESGEDPEAIESDMGDAMEEDPIAPAAPKAARALRRLLPPQLDPELHEM